MYTLKQGGRIDNELGRTCGRSSNTHGGKEWCVGDNRGGGCSLGFRELPNSTNTDAKDNNLHLFIVTTNSVYLYHVSGKGSGGSSVLLDDIGCGLGYAVMDWRAVFARDEAVYAYGLQGKEPPYAYEATSPAMRKLAAQAAGGDGDGSRIMFDMENKVVGYAGMFAKGTREVKPSYVVRKFLDAQHMHNLVTYLQELHALGLANADHTTLLLNIYTKLKDVARLDNFIKTEPRRSGATESNGDLPFDLDTAIRVYRQAGYFDHASYLATRYKQHEEYLRVMIEDAGKYGEALTYLKHLGAAAAESNLARGYHFTTVEHAGKPPSYLSYLTPSGVPVPADKVEESKAEEEEDFMEPQATQPSVPTPFKEKRPSPTLYFVHLVDHPSYFVRFLESVAARRWDQSLSSIPSSLPNAGSDEDSDSEKRNQAADNALKVLTSESSPSYSYTRGLLILWKKLGMYEDVLRFRMDKHNASPLPRFLTSTPELLTRQQADVEKILEHIEKERTIPMLGVVQILSRNGVASVGLVKDWLMGRIKEARQEVQTDQQLINSYQLETNAKLKQVAELEDPMHPKCSGQLDLPSVHFMCNHSYHQRCLLDHETEYPLCVRQHGVIQEIERNNERMSYQHELFLADVQDYGFKVVTDGFDLRYPILMSIHTRWAFAD
ncbi:hypothetical protein BDR03DRAFT_979341 [Suillus americanus]|nr:hypothetical protein BDR03DRAFT_979341 [Suillus americanus]